MNQILDIAIYGFGGLGREISTLLNQINKINPTWNFLGYFDDGYAIGTSNRYGEVLGGLKELNNYPENIAVVMAIASSTILRKLTSQITNPLVSYPNIIAPDVLMFDVDSVKMGKGNIITYGCRLSCDVSLGDFNILNGCVSLGHDVRLGNYNIMFPDVRVSGETVIGNDNFFGAGSFVMQGLTIGYRVRIGAGSYLLKNTKDDYLYMGNPAKRVDIR